MRRRRLVWLSRRRWSSADKRNGHHGCPTTLCVVAVSHETAPNQCHSAHRRHGSHCATMTLHADVINPSQAQPPSRCRRTGPQTRNRGAYAACRATSPALPRCVGRDVSSAGVFMHLLGPFQILKMGQPVSLRSGDKAEQLLSCLALHPRVGVHRAARDPFSADLRGQLHNSRTSGDQHDVDSASGSSNKSSTHVGYTVPPRTLRWLDANRVVDYARYLQPSSARLVSLVRGIAVFDSRSDWGSLQCARGWAATIYRCADSRPLLVRMR